MKRNVLCLLTISLAVAGTLLAEPATKMRSKHSSTKTQKSGGQNTAPNAVTESANGWTFVKGEWVHPDGYKFVNGKILRTTAKTGKSFPKPPGKLALENAQKLSQPTTNSARTNSSTNNTQSAPQKPVEAREKNLTPTSAPQTGTHL